MAMASRIVVMRAHSVLPPITVDDDLVDFPDADFTSIQAAIDVAEDGSVIRVYPGTYTSSHPGRDVVDTQGKLHHDRAPTGSSNTDRRRQMGLLPPSLMEKEFVEGWRVRVGSHQKPQSQGSRLSTAVIPLLTLITTGMARVIIGRLTEVDFFVPIQVPNYSTVRLLATPH